MRKLTKHDQHSPAKLKVVAATSRLSPISGDTVKFTRATSHHHQKKHETAKKHVICFAAFEISLCVCITTVLWIDCYVADEQYFSAPQSLRSLLIPTWIACKLFLVLNDV